jgi:oligopeptide/dipeptide ABC transporter ATP-binding protein
MLPPVMEVRDLETTFFLKNGPVRVVDRISFQMNQGEILGLVGESGCGKSVTSRALLGLIEYPGQITGGEILFKGQDLRKFTEREMADVRGRDIAMIFQEPLSALNPVLTIGQQIEEQVIRHQKSKSPSTRKNKQVATLRALEMLSVVGLSPGEQRAKNYPHQLSGGMRQRAMIAMALSCNPSVLIADEPTTSLDMTIQAQILQLIQSLQQKLNMTTLFITHDLGLVSEISDRVIVMYAGQICEEAPTNELFLNPKHPYTLALIESRPRFGHRVDRLKTINGRVPKPEELTQGCPFSNRCPQTISECYSHRPQLNELDKAKHSVSQHSSSKHSSRQHKVACFNPVGGLS